MITQKDISKKRLWAGRIVTGLVTAVLLGSAGAKSAGASVMVGGLTHAGIPRGAIVPIAALELACLALYLVPRTKLLGMIMLTGYFGGAVVTHIIGQENFFPPLLIGSCVWAGAYLQIPELQQLLPVSAREQKFERTQSQGAPALAKVR
jgi:hypothetical protein